MGRVATPKDPDSGVLASSREYVEDTLVLRTVSRTATGVVECLPLVGEHERAESWFRGATAYANDPGLLAEEAGGATGELLRNIPQAFSHIGLIDAAWRIAHPSAPIVPESVPTTDAPPHGGSP